MRGFNWRLHGAVRLVAIAGLLAAAGCADKKAGELTNLPPSYSISGTVSGAVAADVTITILGANRSVRTNSVGQYTIAGLGNGTYTLEASLAGYTFTPATRTVTVNGAVVTGQNFTAQAGISIAGKVTGDGKQGVVLTLTGPQPATTTRTVTTGADGTYRFLSVAAGSYLVTPALAGGWTFTPANSLVTVAGTSLTGPDFASIPPTHRLSGRITGAFTVGVAVTLGGDGDAVTVTDGAGNYAFAGLVPGSYTVAPSYPGYAFTPAARSAEITTADVGALDFVSAATHKISGRISGDVLAGVKVALGGASTGDTTTDASGYFELTDVASGAYVVTPALDGYTFTPAERPVTVSTLDVTGVSFTASASAFETYTVSGAVTFSGTPLPGVKITLQGATTAVTTTDAAGAFRFQGVAAGEYLVVPSHDDYTFTAASRFIVVSTANVTAQNFTAAVSPSTRTISGTVTGAAIAGVTMTLVGVSPVIPSRTVTTDGTGSFAFRGLTLDGIYSVTPSLAGFAFTPADCLVTVAGPSVTSIRFTSAFAPHAISGRITGPVVGGVTVSLAGGATRTATTAVDGTYSFSPLANGDYTVTPSLPGLYFSPVEAAVTLAGANATGVDFASARSHLIAGHVAGDVLAGVKITLAGAAGAEVTTDPTGIFTFADLRDGSYVLTPALDGYTFDPLQLPTDLAGADLTRANFTATRIPTYTAWGTILRAGIGQGGVSVSLSGAATLTGAPTTTTATTDPSGVYSFSALPNGSYMVIPSATGSTFTPASRAFRIDRADVTGQDFTVAP